MQRPQTCASGAGSGSSHRAHPGSAAGSSLQQLSQTPPARNRSTGCVPQVRQTHGKRTDPANRAQGLCFEFRELGSASVDMGGGL